MFRRLTMLIVGLAALTATGAVAQRQRLSMDPGWRFTLGDPAGAERLAFGTLRSDTSAVIRPAR